MEENDESRCRESWRRISFSDDSFLLKVTTTFLSARVDAWMPPKLDFFARGLRCELELLRCPCESGCPDRPHKKRIIPAMFEPRFSCYHHKHGRVKGTIPLIWCMPLSDGRHNAASKSSTQPNKKAITHLLPADCTLAVPSGLSMLASDR